MSINAIIGWSGLIGQELLLHMKESVEIFNSSTIGNIVGKSFDRIYFCGLPAEKWLINKNPEADLKNLEKVQEFLKEVSCKHFILISTIDVLDTSYSQDENGCAYSQQPYGKHRKMMEDWVKNTQINWTIIRLPGLFGKGLKKNIIYDLIFNNQIENICLDSEFQWYNIENLYTDIENIIDSDLKIVHLFSEPVSVRDIIENYFPENNDKCIGKNIVKYNLKTKYKETSYWKNKQEILEDIGKYINYERRLNKIASYSAVSNICWNNAEFLDISKILKRYRIKNLEIALTKFADWTDFDNNFIEKMKEMPYNFVSCQSILYKTPIKIFEDPEKFVEHYRKVAGICNKLGIKVIVFGSPNQRHTGGKDPEYLIPYFREIGEISKENGLYFCIEPNSKKYGCTWLTNLEETLDYIGKISHINVKLNFDFGNYIMENDVIQIREDFILSIGHIQISNKFLEPLSNIENNISLLYRGMINEILKYDYKGYISLEMKEMCIMNIIKSLDKFIELLI